MILILLCFLSIVIQCCPTGWSYAEYMVTPQFAANNSIRTVCSYNAPESEMGFAIQLFGIFSDERPDYTDAPILLRQDGAAVESGRDVYIYSAKITQICNLTAPMRCRTSKGHNERTDVPIPTFASYDYSKLPPAYYFTRMEHPNGCPTPSNLTYPTALLSNASCVFFYNNAGYFNICSSGFAASIPSCSEGTFQYQNARFCVAPNATSTDIRTNSNPLSIQNGLFRTSHPQMMFVNVCVGDNVSSANPLDGFFF